MIFHSKGFTGWAESKTFDFLIAFFMMNGSTFNVESASHVLDALGKCFRRGSNAFVSGMYSEGVH